jgi:hypothetical protein
MSYVSDSGYGIDSTANNSTTPLGIAGTFTGTAEENPYPDVMISCYSDVSGTLFIEFSVNGTDWRTFPAAGYEVAAGIHEFHTAVKGPRFFRARYVNGGTAQSVLQLYTYYGVFRQPTSPLNQPYALDSDAVITRSTFTWLDVARGLVSGILPIKKFGRNASVGTSFVPIALGGIYNTPQSTSATALRIKAGGNANDTAAGSGARSIVLEGLDENFNAITETVATAGAAASSPTVATFTRLYRIKVGGSGTYSTSAAGSHSGQIVIENAAGGTDWGTIGATSFPKARSEIAAYTVPAGKTGYVKLRNVSVDSGKTIDLIFFSRANADQLAAPYSPMEAQSVVSGVSGGSIEEFGEVDIPFGPYVGPTDIGFMAKVSAGTASVSVEFEIFVIDEII